ncbi:MAG: DNA polymerase III subunit delta [Bacteroidales bacterium]
MTYEQIMKDLKNKIYKPVYLLMGDEPYYLDKITDYIAENVLTPSEKAFNQTIVYGMDTTAGAIDNIARRYPMMASHQVVIVKEAQNLKDIDNLMYYASGPSKSTLLVINYKYKTFDKRKRLYKEISEHGLVFESKKLYENQVPDWISKYSADLGYQIDPVASVLLTDFLGNNLSKISNELDKLVISLPKGTKINSAIIEENIGISKDFNNFELQNALVKKDIFKANQIINYFEKNQKENPIILTISSLFSFFRKILLIHSIKDKDSKNLASVLQIHPFFVKDYQMAAQKYNLQKTVAIISWLREYDMKSKGYDNVSTEPGDLLKELIFKILH